jgi:excisionase family DNA binding protein
MSGINSTLYKEEKLLTKEEVMDFLHIKNPRTFMKLINEQGLPYVKIGRKYCVLSSKLYKWLQENNTVRV